jgi:hypothetical protein
MVEQEDEVIQNFKLDYDGKRDRWNGFDANTYAKVISSELNLFITSFNVLTLFHVAFEKADIERRKSKAETLQSFMTEPDEDHAR